MEWVLGGVVGLFFGDVLAAANSFGRIAGPPIGGDVSAGADVAFDKRANRVRGGVVCWFDSYATAAVFSRDENQRLTCSTTSNRPLSTKIALIDHNEAIQPVATSLGHRVPELMEPVPRSSVRSKTHQSLKLTGVDSPFSRRHLPHRSKPKPQRLSGPVKERAGSYASLMTASLALEASILQLPGLICERFPVTA